jgi:hypothetical protein
MALRVTISQLKLPRGATVVVAVSAAHPRTGRFTVISRSPVLSYQSNVPGFIARFELKHHSQQDPALQFAVYSFTEDEEPAASDPPADFPFNALRGVVRCQLSALRSSAKKAAKLIDSRVNSTTPNMQVYQTAAATPNGPNGLPDPSLRFTLQDARTDFRDVTGRLTISARLLKEDNNSETSDPGSTRRASGGGNAGSGSSRNVHTPPTGVVSQVPTDDLSAEGEAKEMSGKSSEAGRAAEIAAMHKAVELKKMQVSHESVRVAEEVEKLEAARQNALDLSRPVHAAVATSLKRLQESKGLDELRGYKLPPVLVQLVMECVMKIIGKDCSWASAQRELHNPLFLTILSEFEKLNVYDKLPIIRSYTQREAFNSANALHSSRAARELCIWVEQMESYGCIYKDLRQKERQMAELRHELAIKQQKLKEAQAELQSLVEGGARSVSARASGMKSTSLNSSTSATDEKKVAKPVAAPAASSLPSTTTISSTGEDPAVARALDKWAPDPLASYRDVSNNVPQTTAKRVDTTASPPVNPIEQLPTRVDDELPL